MKKIENIESEISLMEAKEKRDYIFDNFKQFSETLSL